MRARLSRLAGREPAGNEGTTSRRRPPLLTFGFRHPWLLALATWAIVGLAIAALWSGVASARALARFEYAGIFAVTVIGGAAMVVPDVGEAGTALAARWLDPLPLGLIAGFGAAIGQLNHYAVGATSERALPARLRSRLDRFSCSRLYQRFQRRSFILLMVLAALPNPVFGTLSIACGSSRMPLWKFFLPVLLGKLVRFLAIAFGAAQVLR